MKKTIIILLLSVAVPASASASASASEQPPMTLQQYLAVGLERNYDIRLVRNNEQIAQNNATRGNAGFYPTVDLSAAYSGTADKVTQYPVAGDKVTVDGVNDAAANAGVNLAWTVFDGFSVQTSYERLGELQRMGELNTRLQTESFISNFTAEYYNYIRQLITLKNLQYAVELSRERVRIVDVSVEIGSLSGYDALQAKVDFNADSSRLVKQFEVIYTLGTSLREMLALTDVDTPFAAADREIVYDSGLVRDELWRSALDNNIYLKIARKEGDISRLDLKAAQSRNYPYLRLNAGYGYSGNWYGANTLARQRVMGANYGVTVGFTIFDGMNRRREQRNARIEIRNRELEQEQTQLALDVDLANAWMAYENNLKLVELERSNLETAQTGYELAMERYKNSQLSGIELREAQTSLLDAEERLVQVVYDTKMCEISLLQIAGLITSYLK